MTSPPDVRRFQIELGRRSRALLRILFRVRPETAYVDVGEDLEARFGVGHVRTPMSNVVSWRLEGPWLWITAIGIRKSVWQSDITFGGTHRGGVRLDFRDRVKALGFRVQALYVTVADPEGFTAELARRGIQGEDARRGTATPT